MKKSFLSLILAATIISSPDLVAAQSPQQEAVTQQRAVEAEIRSLMSRFDTAIRAKDSKGLAALFYDGKINWKATGHPKSREFVAQATKEAIPALEDQGAHQLIGDPAYKALRLAENFGSPTIVSDGQLATVTFRYNFTANDQIQNWGSESWQLVKADDGWKIVNLLFSYTLSAVAPMPDGHLK